MLLSWEAVTRIEVGGVQINNVELFVLDEGVVGMQRTRPKIAAMQVPKDPLAANVVRRLEVAWQDLGCLRAFEKKEARARTVICFNAGHRYPTTVGKQNRGFHG